MTQEIASAEKKEYPNLFHWNDKITEDEKHFAFLLDIVVGLNSYK